MSLRKLWFSCFTYWCDVVIPMSMFDWEELGRRGAPVLLLDRIQSPSDRKGLSETVPRSLVT